MDIVDWLHSSDAAYDIVSLDVDNGLDWTVFETNRSLYTDEGLDLVAQRMRPGGVVSYWNSRRDDEFESRLRMHFESVSVHTVPHPAGIPDCIYLAHRG